MRNTHRALTRGGWTELLVAVVLCAASCAEHTAPDPYVVTVDLRPSIQALGSDDLFASEPAAERLTAIGPVVLPALAAAMDSESAEVRAGIVGVLQDLGWEGVPLLLRAARDDDLQVRREAVLALGFLGAEQGRSIGEAALEEESPAMLRAAIVACGSLCKSRDALKRLVELTIERPQMRVAGQSLQAILASDDEERAAAARAAIGRRLCPCRTDLTRPTAREWGRHLRSP